MRVEEFPVRAFDTQGGRRPRRQASPATIRCYERFASGRKAKRPGPVLTRRIRQARHWCPARYVVFDLLYHAGRCLMREPLARRREMLADVCERLDIAGVRFSEGMVGQGMALYAAALAQGHEGVMAKHLASAYRPGKRSAAWRKIKPRPRGTCQKRDIFS